MADTVTMPKLGFDMAEGTLVRWVVPEGGQVEKGAVLAEIETDKATVEVQSSFSGTVRKQLVQEGSVVPVGTPIAIIGTPDEKIEDVTPSTEEIKQASVEAPPGGFPEKELAGGGKGQQETRPGTIAGVAAMPPQGEAPQAQPTEGKAPEGAEQTAGRLAASPLAARMAAERGIDLRQVKGSGPGGRITKKDIENFKPSAAPAPQAPAQAPAAPAAAPQAPTPARQPAAPLPPSFTQAGPAPADQTVPLSRLRSAVGRRMVMSKQTAPHFYVTHEYNMGPVMEARAKINALLPEGEKLSVNDFIVKAVALTLRQFPNVNAALNGDQVVRHGQVNVGVAVSVEGGLLTVVCSDADRKPIRQISSEVRGMAERARQGKVRPEDIEGSTFSTSNLGMYDVDEFSAIINPPEAAILAVGSVKDVPVVENGEIRPGKRMKATISIDHRVSDGAEAARFLQAMAAYLEEPLTLLL